MKKCAQFKKNLKNHLMKISIFIRFHLKNKTKSGIPILPLFTVPASFNNVCPKSGSLIFWVIWLRSCLYPVHQQPHEHSNYEETPASLVITYQIYS
jgi:hypothetical protein